MILSNMDVDTVLHQILLVVRNYFGTANAAVFLVDAATLSKKPAFDHARIAASLSADGVPCKAGTLPFSEITFVDNESAIQFAAR